LDTSFGDANAGEEYLGAFLCPKGQSILSIAHGQKDIQLAPASLAPFKTSRE